jgi:hypothetical protein
VKDGTDASRDFYKAHDRDKEVISLPRPLPIPSLSLSHEPSPSTRTQVDLARLTSYKTRKDLASYVSVLKQVFSLFGAAIQESLTRTMGKYLQVTGGSLANHNKSEWEKEIAGRMTCTNNGAESPFATVRAFLDIYPRSGPSLHLYADPNPNPDPNPYPYPNHKLVTTKVGNPVAGYHERDT